jgi:hypothetical protein
MILLGCPGVIPECPFDQSYDTAYAKILPLRLKAVAAIGPGEESNAVKRCASISQLKRGEIEIRTLQTRTGIFVPEVDRAIRA